MSVPRPLEVEYLAAAESILNTSCARFELRIQVLEAASSIFGGFNLTAFHDAFEIEGMYPEDKLLEMAAPLVSAIKDCPIHHALALSALARENLQEHNRKSTGAYHTDFRLAKRLAQLALPKLTWESKVIDPASGAGILLAALTYELCGTDKDKIAYWLSNGVYAADLSSNSLRAALLSLASFTDNIEILKIMRGRWYCGDSLIADSKTWSSMAPEGFDGVIGNPPWEKVKISRHEFLKSSGANRHYGAKVVGLNEKDFNTQRNEAASYSQLLLERYPDLRNGEPDLYVAFTSLFFELCKEKGVVSALVPGGLIRSQGTKVIRKNIFERAQSVSLSIIDNRSRFFSIDTRFKFLAVGLVKADATKSRYESISLLHERGTPTGLEVTGSVTICRKELSIVRNDLSIPEVRNINEWNLFSKIVKAGILWEEPNSGWKPKFCREVDMTKQRPNFLDNKELAALPLVEGRMVQAHRFGVKGYISGSGRKALWKAYPIGESCLSPQFWIDISNIPVANRGRTEVLRAGFCDIAGQTNERALMACLIPAGVVCGNKVPTILFPEDPSEDRLLVWVSIVNSFIFDWMLRRVLTTTVNYFLLESVPLPKLNKDSLPWERLVSAARELRVINNAGYTQDNCIRMAYLRAEIDAEIALAYGINLDDMELIFQDFPILDRYQVALPNESKSTITRDSVLASLEKRLKRPIFWGKRVVNAHDLGAMAYIPSELARNNEIF